MLLSLFDLPNNAMHDGDDDLHLDSVMEDLPVPPSLGLKRRDIFTGIESIEMAGHCDGVICLIDHRKNVVLCNPEIKEFSRLPISSLAISCADLGPDGTATCAVGFGLDLKSETYKVVRILRSGRVDNDIHTVINPPKAEIFSLVTRTWQEIKTDNIDNETTNIWPDSTVFIYCKGTLYWRAHEENKEFEGPICYTDDENDGGSYNDSFFDRERIIAFDMGNQKFQVMSFPSGYYFHVKVFGLWNESTAVCTCWSPEDPNIDILVLVNPGGDDTSWINCLRIKLETLVYIDFQFALVGKIGNSLMVAVDKSVVIFYDIITGKYTYLPISGVSLQSTRALFYVKCSFS